MIAVPADTAVIVPLATVANAVLVLDQIRALFEAFSGCTVGTSVSVSPTVSAMVARLSVTPVTAISSLLLQAVKTAESARMAVVVRVESFFMIG